MKRLNTLLLPDSVSRRYSLLGSMTLNLNIKADRKKAFRDAYWGDHGFLRTHFRNKHDLGGSMFRENQPNPSRISRWAEEGIKTVINLRGESAKGFYRLEREACDAHGLALWNFRMHSRDTHTVTKIKAARNLFEMIEYPAVMHCKSGADRTGIMGVLFKHFQMGEPIEKALDQLSFKYMHVKHGKTGVLDFFFEDYIRHHAEHPIEFMEWVETIYDPADLKARFMAGKFGSFVTDRVLRRE